MAHEGCHSSDGSKRKWKPQVLLLVGMQTGAATMENSMEVPQNTKIELPYDQLFYSWVYSHIKL